MIRNKLLSPPLFIFILSLLIIWPLFLPGYFSHHDDLQVMRIFEMRRCLLDLQIPCRWVPDLGFGNGFPLFNYYSGAPYYIGAFASFFLGYIWSAKLLFLIVLTVSGIGMYYLGRELYGRLGGFLACILYLLAPYKAVDTYVRGAIAESFALTLIPFVFLFFIRLIRYGKLRDFYLSAFALAAFLTCHNIMTILFLPVLIITLLLFFLNEKKNFIYLSGSFLLGFGLAAFFILPAFFEKNLIQSESLTRFDLDFRAHFATIRQLFLSRFWDYGASVPGPYDGMSFQLGWPHWWIVVLACLVFLGGRFKSKFQLLYALFLIVVFSISTFMMHNKSAFIWEQLPLLQYAQFPWRFLSLSIFSSSLLGGFLIYSLREGWQVRILWILTLLTLVLNVGYFHPKEFIYGQTDLDKLSGKLWEDQQKSAIFDYLPKTAIESKEPAPSEPMVISGESIVSNYINRSNGWRFNIEVTKLARVEMPVYDFPNWTVFKNEQQISHDHQNLLGRISFNLDPGKYIIRGEFKDTWIRVVANTITLVSFISLFLINRFKIKKSD